MDHAEPLRVEVTIESTAQSGPLRGELLADGTRRPFSGRFGLALALEAAINDHRELEETPPCHA